MQPLRTFVLAALVAAPSLAQCLTLPNAQPGTNLNLTDDSGSVRTLPFAFPFNGQLYTQISICSNGYIWLGSRPTGPWDFTDSEAEFLSQAPRIAPCWDDWNPSAGGAVYYLADATAANIVWKGVQRFGAAAVLADMEVVLLPSGVIVLHYAPTMGVSPDASIAGITAGNNAPASPLTWSTLPAVANATGYELAPANSFSLAGTTLLLAPSSPASYSTVNVTGNLPNCTPLGNYPPLGTSTLYGTGCPQPRGASYEDFASGTIDLSNLSIRFVPTGAGSYVAIAGPGLDTSYATTYTQGDDTLVANLALGFPFPYGGQAVTSVNACSNGYLWLDGSTGTDFSPSVAEFLAQGQRIGVWGDWNFTGGGTFYFDQGPGFAMATYLNVAAFGVAGSSNTFQIKLLASGDIILSFGPILNNSTTGLGECLTGFTGGNGAADPGNADYSAAIANPGTLLANIGVPPLSMVNNYPTSGATWSLTATQIPAGTAIGAFVLGFTQLNPGLDLSGLGMPGCFQYTSIDATFVQLVGGPSMTLPLPIPGSSSYYGLALNAQAATFSGFTPLGVITSNGLQGIVGM